MGEGQETVDMARTTRLWITFSLMSFAGLILGGCNNSAAGGAAPSSTSSTSNTLPTSGNPATAGTASLSWLTPPANSNGTLEVEGYHIYFGSSAQNLTHVVNVESPNATSFVINNLPAGTWYFGIASYNAEKVESSMSAIVSAGI
jgi:hypothetical protein